MKKLLITLLVLTLVPISFVTAQVGAKTNLVLYGTINTQNSFETADGGINFGLEFRPDKDMPLWLRGAFSRFNFGDADNEIKSIKTLAYVEYYIGKKWDINLVVGYDNYVSGDLSGSDGLVGLDLKRKIWTLPSPNMEIPATLSFMGGVTFVDVEDDSYNNAMQINLGFSFNPGVK